MNAPLRRKPLAHYRPSASAIEATLANIRPTRDDDGNKLKRCTRKGTFGRRLIAETVIGGVEYALPATKGWRARYRGA